MRGRVAVAIAAALFATEAAAFETSELGARLALGVTVGAPLVSARLSTEAEWWRWSDVGAGLHLGLSAGRSPGAAWESVAAIEPQASLRTVLFEHDALLSAGLGFAYVWSNPVGCDGPLCGWIVELRDRPSFVAGLQATLLRPGDDGRIGALLVRLEWLSAGLAGLSVSFGLDLGG